ncbi:MAG: MASE3 domain-containing protein [Nitrospirota bacterium]
MEIGEVYNRGILDHTNVITKDFLQRLFGISIRDLTIPVMLTVLLIASSFYSYLLFHTFAEMFAVIVAIIMFIVAWQMYPFTRNQFLMYLGCGYFWIGALDMVHAFVYKGMTIYQVSSGNLATQFWIVTRYLEASLLLTAPFFLHWVFFRNLIFIIFGIITSTVYILVMNSLFPDCFIEGTGLTSFKIYSEYIIIVLLGAAIYHMWKKHALLETRIVRLMMLAIVLTIAAELSFTFYVSVYGLSNLLGHIFKFFSFWLIFMAVIRTSLQEPFRAMARGASTYDAVPDATVVVDKDCRIMNVNEEARRFTGRGDKDLNGLHCHEFFHPANLERDRCPLCINIIKGVPLKMSELKYFETGQWFDFTLSPVSGASELRGMVQVMRNITERKKAVEELKGKEEQVSLLLNSTAEAIYGLDVRKHCTFCNPACIAMLGYDRPEDLLGRNMHELIHHTRADGQTHDIEDCKIYSVLQSGEGVHVVDEVLWRRDGSSFPTEYWSHPVYKNGVIVGAVVTFLDVTERRNLERQLLQAQKMEAIGQLAGGVAHDFNNILSAIINYGFMAKKGLEGYSSMNYIDNILSLSEKAADITRGLLTFSRKQHFEFVPVHLNDIVSSIQKLLFKFVGEDIDFRINLTDKDPVVMADGTQIEQVIFNLATNARDAMSGRGVLTIRTEIVEINNDFIKSHGYGETGLYGVVSVEDTGVGMDEDTRQKIFDPFFTTKDVGKGTGLGLSIVYGIVKQHNGLINVYSEPGQGTIFRIYLPVIEAVVKKGQREKLPDLKGGGETILLAEDETAVRESIGKILEDSGYEVIEAVDGRDALEKFKEHKDRIKLLILDMVMPRMNGSEVYDAVRQINPDIKAVFTSGYLDPCQRNKTFHEKNVPFISKPVFPDRFLIKIKEVLKG